MNRLENSKIIVALAIFERSIFGGNRQVYRKTTKVASFGLMPRNYFPIYVEKKERLLTAITNLDPSVSRLQSSGTKRIMPLFSRSSILRRYRKCIYEIEFLRSTVDAQVLSKLSFLSNRTHGIRVRNP